MPKIKRSAVEYRNLFLRRLFDRGQLQEQLFQRLCNAGCNGEALADLLFGICRLAVSARSGFIKNYDISAAELRRLTADLFSLAGLVERVNRTHLNPKIDLLSAPPDSQRDPARRQFARLYDLLPEIMRTYSLHLEHFSKFNRKLLKRMTFIHLETVRLLVYIEKRTGSPRYDDTSNLLTNGFFAAGGHDDSLPKFFTADALAKLKQRTVKFGLMSRF